MQNENKITWQIKNPKQHISRIVKLRRYAQTARETDA